MADVLPYGRQTIEDDDVAAVAEALRSDYLTTGPRVAAFEAAFAETVGARHAVACSSGTAALHLAMLALGAAEGDAVVVPAITFAATANCARYVGCEVVFADVDPETALMTPATLEAALGRLEGRRLAAVLPVHLTGAAADLPGLKRSAGEAPLIEDACHALGTTMAFDNVRERVGDGRHGAMACFSFHPVKTITTAEGGMVTTNDQALAERLALFRSHGIERDPAHFEDQALAGAPWAYEMQGLGFNYRLPDVLCALGISQLAKLERFTARRRRLAALYREALAPLAPMVRPLAVPPGCDAALHLFVVLIDFDGVGRPRAEVMEALKAKGIGTQVHYIPVPRQPYYVRRYGRADLPGADRYYRRCLSLPLYPGMEDGDVERVAEALQQVLGL
jgi:UDP-4-amino-4,6-dideoxy-N-acetyl-beta-L-altrosamine transaminase